MIKNISFKLFFSRLSFLKKTLISILGIYFPIKIISQTNKNSEVKTKIIIVGAGAAGLYAGFLLKSKGIDFLILEASNQYGGRLGKIDDFADFPLDSGAQWLHGEKNIVGKLVKSSKTKITKDISKVNYWFKNKLVKKLKKKIDIFLNESKKDISYLEFAKENGFGKEYKYIIESIAGDHGASASKLSAKYNSIEGENWSSGSDDFKFKDTYFDLIDSQIASKIKKNILLNTVVEKIDYSSNIIQVTDKNNKIFESEKILITIPISILKLNKIKFNPALPQKKLSAFSKIGMGAGIKIFIKFKNKFYDGNTMGGKICATYIDESIGKFGKDNILLCFIMGDQADYLNSISNENEIIKLIIEELDLIYNNQASKNYISNKITNWSTKEFIQGAYSYSSIRIGNSREIASKEIDDKVFFAGEAMNLNGHHQTVFGAMETAELQINKMID